MRWFAVRRKTLYWKLPRTNSVTFLTEKFGRGVWGKMLHFPLFLRGVLEKVVCKTWFFCGENVVKCVVNVEKKLHVFAAEEWDRFLKYFCASPDWASADRT